MSMALTLCPSWCESPHNVADEGHETQLASGDRLSVALVIQPWGDLGVAIYEDSDGEPSPMTADELDATGKVFTEAAERLRELQERP